MNKTRLQRIGEEIKKELSVLLQTEVKDPRVGFVTVTDVEVTNDLQYAKVFVSVLGGAEQREASLVGLNKAKGFLRTEIGRRIKLRQVPDLVFKLDESIDYGNRIENLLKEISEDKGDRPS